MTAGGVIVGRIIGGRLIEGSTTEGRTMDGVARPAVRRLSGMVMFGTVMFGTGKNVGTGIDTGIVGSTGTGGIDTGSVGRTGTGMESGTVGRTGAKPFDSAARALESCGRPELAGSVSRDASAAVSVSGIVVGIVNWRKDCDGSVMLGRLSVGGVNVGRPTIGVGVRIVGVGPENEGTAMLKVGVVNVGRAMAGVGIEMEGSESEGSPMLNDAVVKVGKAIAGVGIEMDGTEIDGTPIEALNAGRLTGDRAGRLTPETDATGTAGTEIAPPGRLIWVLTALCQRRSKVNSEKT